jgi:hypothetical protein
MARRRGRGDTQFLGKKRAAHPQFVDIAVRLFGEMPTRLLEPPHHSEPALIGKRAEPRNVIHRHTSYHFEV